MVPSIDCNVFCIATSTPSKFGVPPDAPADSVSGGACWVQYRMLLEMIVVLGVGGTGQFGFQISVLNSPSPYIKKFINETWATRYSSPISHRSLILIWTSIESIISFGGIIGCLAAGYLSRKYGKKMCLLWNNLILVGASLIMGCSKLAKSFEMLLIGRFLLGLYTGLSFIPHVQYVGEIAPKKLRGLINTTLVLFISLGILSGQFLGLSELLGTESLWPLLVSINGISSLVQLARIPFFPESPSYLLMEKGDRKACLEAMKQLWGEGDIQEEMDDLMKEQEARRKVQCLSILEILRDRSSRWQLYLLFLMILTKNICGDYSIYFYSYDIFYDAGVSPQHIPHVNVGIGICDAMSVLVCAFVADMFGMKTILLTGYVLMATALALLTVTLSLTDWYPWMAYCSVVLVFMFMVFQGVGPGGVSLPITVSNFTQASRPPAVALTGITNFSAMFIIGMIFPHMMEMLGSYTFLIFVGLIAVSGTLLYFFLPETKGLSTMEITEQFAKWNFQGHQSVLSSGAQTMCPSSAQIMMLRDSMKNALHDAKGLT
ncbi:solute carrier family 2, facilitated glucose transporter member 11-like [Lissotriton helveticus]